MQSGSRSPRRVGRAAQLIGSTARRAAALVSSAAGATASVAFLGQAFREAEYLSAVNARQVRRIQRRVRVAAWQRRQKVAAVRPRVRLGRAKKHHDRPLRAHNYR